MNVTNGAADAQRLGAFIGRRRRDLQVTQIELAELAGVSTRSVSALEAGKPTVRLDILMPVLAVLGIDLVDAIEGR